MGLDGQSHTISFEHNWSYDTHDYDVTVNCAPTFSINESSYIIPEFNSMDGEEKEHEDKLLDFIETCQVCHIKIPFC